MLDLDANSRSQMPNHLSAYSVRTPVQADLFKMPPFEKPFQLAFHFFLAVTSNVPLGHTNQAFIEGVVPKAFLVLKPY